MKKISRLFLIVVILLVALSLGSSQSALAIEKQARDRALASAAFLAILDQNGEMMGAGSGTFISADGLILTNFHVVGDPDTGELYHQDGLVGIGVIEDPTEPAIPRFYAQAVVGDPSLDLAVVRVVSYLDGDSLPSNLNLTHLPLGDSDALGFGDDIISIGCTRSGGRSTIALRPPQDLSLRAKRSNLQGTLPSTVEIASSLRSSQ